MSYLFNKMNYGNKNNLMAGLIVGGCVILIDITPVCSVVVALSVALPVAIPRPYRIDFVAFRWDKYSKGTVWTIPLGGGMVQQPFSLGGKYLCEHRQHS